MSARGRQSPRHAPRVADWSPRAREAPWTVGVEEEVMLLDAATGRLSWRGDDVLALLPEEVQSHAAAETHACAVELATEPHATVAGAVAQLGGLRAGLAAAVRPLGIAPAVAGMHPTALWSEVELSPGARYQYLYATLGELARREPTFGLHVHVAVPDAEVAVVALNGVRAHLPLLLALSAASPFWQGRDARLASARTVVFGGFPRTGPPRHFDSYADYRGAIDVLVAADAIPEPTFLWWDARLQPRFGTLEVRVMDAQPRIADAEVLVALTRAAVRLEALEGGGAPPPAEVLQENRFLATRDGMDAALVDHRSGTRRPARAILAELVGACRPHAEDLGCADALDASAELAQQTAATRQRRAAARAGGDLAAVVRTLRDDYALRVGVTR